MYCTSEFTYNLKATLPSVQYNGDKIYLQFLFFFPRVTYLKMNNACFIVPTKNLGIMPQE